MIRGSLWRPRFSTRYFFDFISNYARVRGATNYYRIRLFCFDCQGRYPSSSPSSS